MKTNTEESAPPSGANMPAMVALEDGELPALEAAAAKEPRKQLTLKELATEIALLDEKYGRLLASIENRLMEMQEKAGAGPVHHDADPVGAHMSAALTDGLDCPLVGGIFNCPECGLRIIGPSLTAENGSKGGYYEHSFAESPKLGGKQCRLSGRKFLKPSMRLEFAIIPAKGLTGAKQ